MKIYAPFTLFLTIPETVSQSRITWTSCQL